MRTHFLTLLTGISSLGLFVSQAVAITGGQVDQDNIYPNVGCVVFTGIPGVLGPDLYCTGTLIHPRVFLTAGHCTFPLSEHLGALRYLRVSFGNDAFVPATWHEIEAVMTHPDFRPARDPGDLGANPHMNDVGVVILKEPIYDVPLATLPEGGFLDDLKAAGLLREPSEGGERFTVVGYGSTLDWPPPESVAGDGWRRFAETEYLTSTQSWLFTLQNPATGNGGTGFGDSGGPTFWIADDGTLVLVAVTSRGTPTLVGNNIAWRVDIPETLDFVHGVIELVDAGLL